MLWKRCRHVTEAAEKTDHGGAISCLLDTGKLHLGALDVSPRLGEERVEAAVTPVACHGQERLRVTKCLLLAALSIHDVP